MRWVSRMKWVGISIILVACVLMGFLLFPSLSLPLETDEKSSSAVFQIFSGNFEFPKSDYQFLFSKMGLEYRHFRYDGVDALRIRDDLVHRAEELGVREIILLAAGDMSRAALEIAASWENVVGLVLVSPAAAAPEDFLPRDIVRLSIPIGIFDGAGAQAVHLYEILSGEDASLLPGYSESGFLANTVYLSPSADRFLSKWTQISATSVFRVFLPFFPQVQVEIAGFISTFVFPARELTARDCRGYVFVIHGVKTLALAFLLVGYLLFLAGIEPAAKRAIASEEKTENFQGMWEQPRFFGRKLLLSFLSLLVFLLLTIFLFFHGNMSAAAAVLSVWPVFFFLVQAVGGGDILLRALRDGRPTRFSGKEFLPFFCVLVISFFLLRRLQIFSLRFFPEITSIVPFCIVFIGLFATLFSRLTMDDFEKKDRGGLPAYDVDRSQKFLILLSLVPYLLLFILGFFFKNTALLVMSVELLLAFSILLWVKNRNSRFLVSPFWSALVTSLLYAILVFG